MARTMPNGLLQTGTFCKLCVKSSDTTAFRIVHLIFDNQGNNTVHLPSVDIPHSAQVFKGNGTVAMLGYRNASRIDAQILVINPQEIRVFWPSLRKISKFVKHK